MVMKYELTDEKDADGLYRIRALKDFGNVKKGDLGGFVESEANLSHDGNCWIYNGAKVYNDARIIRNARILNCAKVFENARVSGNATIEEFAKIFGSVLVCEDAIISEFARISGEGGIGGDAWISGFAQIITSNGFRIYGDACVCGETVLQNHQNISSGRLMVEADDFARAQDSRDYTFLVAWKNNEIISVTAGCRVWNTVQEARNYFLTDYESDGDVDECLTILENLERIFHLKTR